MATEHTLYQTMGKFDVFTESELLQVKVPMVFSRHGGFLATEGGMLVEKIHA